MEFKVEVIGLKGIEDGLTEAGPKIARHALRKGLAAAGQIFLDDAKSRAPVLPKATPHREPGELRDALDMKITLSSSQEKGIARIGIAHEKAKHGEEKINITNQNPSVWGSFVEFGSIHGEAQPYMRPAYEGRKTEALDVFTETMREGVESLKK